MTGDYVMKFNPDIHHRRSIRLKGYDYSRCGAYFITLCLQNRKDVLFGEIIDAVMNLNDAGKLVDFTWNDLINHNDNIVLDSSMIMPDHFHGIIIIENPIVGAGSRPVKLPTLSEIVRQFKTFSARRINELRQASGIPVWQRNYYEHIIRNDEELYRIREYIDNNPLNWENNKNNPKHKCRR
jgi:putative transposase